VAISNPSTSVPSSSTANSSSANPPPPPPPVYLDLISQLEDCDNIEDRSAIIVKLEEEYQQLASANRIRAKKEEVVHSVLQDVLRKHQEASEEITMVKSEYDNVHDKHSKLKSLSQQLTDRTQASDAQSRRDIELDRQLRSQLSDNFSQSIAKVSKKLESLSGRREACVLENSRLKGILKEYLEEFDAIKGNDNDNKNDNKNDRNDNNNDHGNDDKNSNNNGDPDNEKTGCNGVEKDEASPPVAMSMESTISSTVDKDASTTGTIADQAKQQQQQQQQQLEQKEEELKQSEEQLAAERERMASEEDISRLQQLSIKESVLRRLVAEHAQKFDTFQTRLQECNAVFHARQKASDGLNREISRLEKANLATVKRVEQCVASTKAVMQQSVALAKEQKLATTKLDRFVSLMNTLQQQQEY